MKKNYYLSYVLRGDGMPCYDLLLHGNKRNERNEIYRKKITDEVSHFYVFHKFHS